MPAVGLIGTGPLEASQGVEAGIAHARMVRTQAAHFIPHRFGTGIGPRIAQQTRQIAQNRDVIACLARRVQGFTDTLHPPLTIGDRALCLAPTRCGRKDHMGFLRGGGQKDVLDHQVLQPFQKMHDMGGVRL